MVIKGNEPVALTIALLDVGTSQLWGVARQGAITVEPVENVLAGLLNGASGSKLARDHTLDEGQVSSIGWAVGPSRAEARPPSSVGRTALRWPETGDNALLLRNAMLELKHGSGRAPPAGKAAL